MTDGAKQKRPGPTPGVRKGDPRGRAEIAHRGVKVPRELWPVLDWLSTDCAEFRRNLAAWLIDCYRRGDGESIVRLGEHINAHGTGPADPILYYLEEFFTAISYRDEDDDGNPVGPVQYVGGKRPERYTTSELIDWLANKGVTATEDQVREAKRVLGIKGVRGRRRKSG